jgi:hypothetical protein
MFSLLSESLNEIFSRPMALLKTFWLTAVLYLAVLLLFYAGIIALYEAATIWIVVIAFIVAPGAVKWHRHVLAEETVGWLPRLPDLKSISYAAKLCVVMVFIGMSQKVASSIAQDILLPFYGLATGVFCRKIQPTLLLLCT